jgi:hypothetical protein
MTPVPSSVEIDTCALTVEMLGEPVQDASRNPWAENTSLRRRRAWKQPLCRLVTDYRRGEAMLAVMNVSV